MIPDVPLHPEVPTGTWNGEGMPLKKTNWIENGVVKNLAYDRFWAQEKGVDAVPFPSNLIMDGGDASLEDLIKSAMDSGVEIVACSMSMDVMGIMESELIDGIKIGGVGYYLGQAEDSNETAGANREEGGDDVKSSRPLRPGLHTCYNGMDREQPLGDQERIYKPYHSSDRSLQLDSVKLESLVIAYQP